MRDERLKEAVWFFQRLRSGKKKKKERKKAKSFRRKIERNRFLFNPTDSKGVGPSKVFVEEVEKVHCDPIGNSFERSNSRNDTNRFVSTTILRILATVNTILSIEIDSRSLSLHSVDTNAGDRRTFPLSSPYKNFVPTKLSLKLPLSHKFDRTSNRISPATRDNNPPTRGEEKNNRKAHNFQSISKTLATLSALPPEERRNDPRPSCLPRAQIP